MLDLPPSVLIADKNDEKEESSKKVAAVHNPEEYINHSKFRIEFIMDDEMHTFHSPRKPKDKEKLQMEQLKINHYLKCFD